MKRVHLIISIFVVSAMLIIIILAIVASNKQEKYSNYNSKSNPGEDVILFYYGNTCPHCKITEQYILDNNIDTKIKIIRKEVYENQANSLALQQAAKQCNLLSDEIGVPFMTYNNSCYMGDEDTINLLKQLASVN